MRISDWSSDVCSSDLILTALEADGGEWAEKELATLRGKSPQTCKVALRRLKEGGEMHDFAQQMRQEYAIGSRVVQMHELIEGVRALIIDKEIGREHVGPPCTNAHLEFRLRLAKQNTVCRSMLRNNKYII